MGSFIANLASDDGDHNDDDDDVHDGDGDDGGHDKRSSNL